MRRQPWITPSLFDNTGNSKIIDEVRFDSINIMAWKPTRRLHSGRLVNCNLHLRQRLLSKTTGIHLLPRMTSRKSLLLGMSYVPSRSRRF